jgi:arginine decarboxylase
VRNRYGIIGPILPERLSPEAIKAAIKANPLVTKGIEPRPVHSIVTNSTYDGLCYNARRVTELLDPSVDRIHFDEAWYAYARFNPLYRDRHAMYGDPKDYTKGPTIFATHSTHKLLAALSQASFLHIRDGRKPIPHSRFNESYMLHASTSPFYPIIVSNDVTAAMMDGAGGIAITAESIQEAVAFRQTMGRVHREFAAKKEWFFNTWNPDNVKQGKNGKTVAFADAAPEFLATEPEVWVLHPGDAWHGFGDIEDGYCMLDPIKVSIVTPGMTENGLDKKGIPATLVTAYLHRRGVEVEKTTDFTILLLFSIGITKGKWGTLLNALLDFKRDYDRNSPLTEVLPDLASSSPATYGGIGLRDLADQMFAQLKETKQTHWLSEAFSTLPKMEMSPNAAYQHLVKDEIEHVPLDKLANRVLATSVVPYPPGIPMLMPGEATGAADGPYIGYLKALAAWDARFPGFGHDTHGVENRDGVYYVQCLKANPGKA